MSIADRDIEPDDRNCAECGEEICAGRLCRACRERSNLDFADLYADAKIQDAKEGK